MLPYRSRRTWWDNLLDRGPMLTPLIDIMFLVLIFFMVNNNPAQRKLGVQTPSMPSAGEARKEGGTLLIAVRPDLSYSIQLQKDHELLYQWHSRTPSTPKQLRESLERQISLLKPISREIRRIRLRADQSLDYGTVIAICDLLYPWELPLELDVSAPGDTQDTRK